jgi:hypothetical protein
MQDLAALRFNPLSAVHRIGLALLLGMTLLLALYPASPAQASPLTCPGGARLYVKQGGSGSNGSNWANALPTLQDALYLANTCATPAITEIWVAEGVYYPNDGLYKTNNRNATFQLKNNLAIYGGFAGSETELEQRDWQAYPTILSGDIDQNDTNTDGNNIAESTSDIQGANAYHVVTGSGTNNTAILDGFVITAGQADGDWEDPCGPMCGGGMYNVSGSPTLTNVSFSGNSANDEGGGMWNHINSSPTLTNVSFSGNSAEDGGGMVNRESSSPTLTNVSFTGNSADSAGGMYNLFSSSPTLTNVSFSGNSAGFGGGGMYNDNSSPTLTNVSFSGNLANNEGGGMSNYESSPTLTNVSFSGNSGWEGGGMWNYDSSSPAIQNTIFWNNKDASGIGTPSASIFNDASSIPTIDYSLVQGWNPAGLSNLNGTDASTDPLFIAEVDPASAPTTAGNLRLQAGSPAINAGNNAADLDAGGSGTATIADIATDLAGAPRHVGAAVDMGAHEFSLACPPGSPTRLYVKENGTGSSGANWNDALASLQDALYLATNCSSSNQIWVAQGIYYPDEGLYQTNNNHNATFQLKNNLAIYGGFAGTETNLSQRNWQSNPTILSGDIDQDDTNTDGNNIAESTSDIQGANAYHVVTGSGTGSSAVLDGFTITAGQADGDWEGWPCGSTCGGGMYNHSGSPTVTNVSFSGNSADYGGGGGMYNNNSSPTLTNVSFSGNSADYGGGGGMWNHFNSSPTLTDVSFSGNSASYGGGIYNYDVSGLELTNVSFSGNSADHGGGMFNYDNSSPTLTNVSFSGNSAERGGGMYNRENSPVLTNVSFSGNSALEFGGGMRNRENSSPVLTNVSFSGNSAQLGGGMYNVDNSSFTMRNSIFWNNQDSTGTGTPGASIFNVVSSATIEYSLVQGWNPSGQGNLNGTDPANNPLFVEMPNPDSAPTTAGNLRLQAGSPAIDKGNNDADLDAGGSGTATIADIDTDLDGNARIVEGTVDLGAYESQYETVCEIAASTYTIGLGQPIGVAVTNAGTLACITVTYFPTSHPNASSDTATGAYWTISGIDSGGDTASGFSLDLTLPAAFVPDANDRVCRYTGTNQEWECAASEFSASTVTRSGVTQLSDWSLGNFAAPTGVTLLSFEVVRLDATSVRAEWSTASELNVLGFHLWRSHDGQRSQALRITQEMLEPQGDMLFGADYLFVDGGLQPETSYSYWLQEITASGSIAEYGPATAHPAGGANRIYMPLLSR